MSLSEIVPGRCPKPRQRVFVDRVDRWPTDVVDIETEWDIMETNINNMGHGFLCIHGKAKEMAKQRI